MPIFSFAGGLRSGDPQFSSQVRVALWWMGHVSGLDAGRLSRNVKRLAIGGHSMPWWTRIEVLVWCAAILGDTGSVQLACVSGIVVYE